MSLFGNNTRKLKTKAWKSDVERGKRIKAVHKIELARRKAEAKEVIAEKKRQTELTRLKKRTELFTAQAKEREALTRRKHAKRGTKPDSFEFGIGKKKKRILHKREKRTKIGW